MMSQKLPPVAGKMASFQVFRYQLVVDKAIQLDIEGKYNTPEQIRAAKNDIFQELISNERFHFQSSKSEITSKLMYSDANLSYFKVGVKRNLKHINKDFSEDVIENYPNIIIAINNDPDVQKIAIQTNTNAFKSSNIVSHFIEETIDRKLKSKNLSFFVEPMFDKQEFWNMVEKYQKRIKKVTFDLISPNLPEVSKNLTVDLNLKQLYEDTNTLKTKLELGADEGRHLEINPSSSLINGLVNYSADGGGDISMRVMGMRNKLHTAQSPREFSLEEQLLKSNNWDALNEAFKDILI